LRDYETVKNFADSCQFLKFRVINTPDEYKNEPGKSEWAGVEIFFSPDAKNRPLGVDLTILERLMAYKSGKYCLLYNKKTGL
jgi:hypothetical protein